MAFNDLTSTLFHLQNRLRQNPQHLLAHLEKRLLHFNGRYLTLPNGTQLKTKEGPKAVQECIVFLQNQQPLYPLAWSDPLASAAQDHAEDLGSRGLVTHQGPNGTTLKMRIEKYAKWKNLLGENMTFGIDDPIEILLQLLIDDGVQGRGHRNNIFTAAFSLVGIHFAHHVKYSICGVIDYAGDILPYSRLEVPSRLEEIPDLFGSQN